VPYKQDTVAKLLEQPFPFLAMNPRTLADIEADIRLLGGITQRTVAAEQVVKKMRQAFSQIKKRAQRRKQRVRVYCEAWPNPRISSPPWVAELVDLCGGEMVVPAGEKVTDAQVALAKPEVIVLAWAATGAKADPKQAYKVTAWKGVPAIRNRRVHVIRDELLNTPATPLVQGARELWNVLHSQIRSKREKRRKR
jgi:iron complex transport system substrate-binding protein